MSNNNSDITEEKEEKIRIAAVLPKTLLDEMETLRLDLEIPPSKTGFLNYILERGMEAYRKEQGKSKN